MTQPRPINLNRNVRIQNSDHTRIYVLHASMVSNWVNSRVRARNRPIHITRLGCHLGRLFRVSNPSTPYEVPKFSFDIFLKYNPNKSPNPEPLIRNNLKIFVGKNMTTTPSNQPKSRMYEFKTQDHTRIYVLHASMVSNWVNSRVRARN